MTYQKRKTMELSDIKAFVFTCTQCGIATTVPCDSTMKRNRLDKCPYCDEAWLRSDSMTITAFDDFWNALKKLQGVVGRTNFTLALEVSPDREDAAPSSSSRDA